MSLTIYNTLSRKKEPFQPLQEGKVGMYVCGVTVYDFSHIGHARAAIVFDVIFRYLKHKGYEVTYVPVDSEGLVDMEKYRSSCYL